MLHCNHCNSRKVKGFIKSPIIRPRKNVPKKNEIVMIVSSTFATCIMRTKPRCSGSTVARVTHPQMFRFLSESTERSDKVDEYSLKIARINFSKVNLVSNLPKQGVSIRKRQFNTSTRASANSLDKNVHYYINNGLGSIVLLIATGVALIFANIAKTAPLYEYFWSSYMGPQTLNLSMTLHHWVNEGLMALFFFSVGLEIKREFIHGSLSSMKQAILPCFGAVGGMLVPMLFYMTFNLASSNGVLAGWAIPMATDIAFAMGVYGFFKNKMPAGVAAFLLTLATVDDLGAILVIAIFFSKTLIKEYVFLAVVVSGLMFAACKKKVTNIKVYMSLFVLLWYFLLQGGINADIAGVITALAIPGNSLAPAKSKAPPEHEGQSATLLDHLIHAWSPWTTLLVMPLFALANTAVLIDRTVFGSIMTSPVGQGIFFGLMLGKPIGIAGISWLAIKLRIAKFPEGMHSKHLVIVGLLGGIGFTMSLFLIEMALSGNLAAIKTAKMAILSSSFASALLGCAFMKSLPEYHSKKN